MRFARNALLCVGLALVSPAFAKTTVVNPQIAFAPKQHIRITSLKLDTVLGVFMNDEDRDTVQRKIQTQLDARQPAPALDAPAYTMEVWITRYTKGSAAARMTLIGLGQIRMEGRVKLIDAAGATAGEFDITKRFMMGGVAGALGTADGVQTRFAKAVIAVVSPPTEAQVAAASKKKGKSAK